MHTFTELPNQGRRQGIQNGNNEVDQEAGTSVRRFPMAAGYGIFSVSPSNIERVRRYIANQEANHKSMSFQDEFREMCKRHGFVVDERYVWD
jgi:hypothetical protein